MSKKYWHLSNNELLHLLTNVQPYSIEFLEDTIFYFDIENKTSVSTRYNLKSGNLELRNKKQQDKPLFKYSFLRIYFNTDLQIYVDISRFENKKYYILLIAPNNYDFNFDQGNSKLSEAIFIYQQKLNINCDKYVSILPQDLYSGLSKLHWLILSYVPEENDFDRLYQIRDTIDNFFDNKMDWLEIIDEHII